MKNRIVNIGLLFLLHALILSSCWKQHDTLSISEDGTLKFVTRVEITEKGFSYADIEELSDDFIHDLTAAGWTVKKEWIKKEYPFNMKFVGSGNITTIESNSVFYSIKKVSDKEYQIKFFPAEAQGGKSSRSITLTEGSLPLIKGGVKIKNIDNVVSNKVYTVRLN